MSQIWMYWESAGSPMPRHISLCIESVKKNAGATEIRLLNQDTVHDFLPDLRQDWGKIRNLAHKADYVRTRLVHQFGGMWLDCDMVALRELEPLLAIPEPYDYACQNVQTSIGCFVAHPGCKLLSRIIEEQDRVLDESQGELRWNAIGNELLTEHGKDYPYHAWPKWYLDEIAGGKVSKLLSWNEKFEDNIDANAHIFHLCNGNLGPLLKLYAREDRLLTSHMLISQVFRRALHVDEDKGRGPIIRDYVDAAMLKIGRTLRQRKSPASS